MGANQDESRMGASLEWALFRQCVTIPGRFLKTYAQLGLSDLEAMLIVHLFGIIQTEEKPSSVLEKLESYMACDKEAIQALIAGLIEKGMLAVTDTFDFEQGYTTEYNLDGLFMKLAQLEPGVKGQPGRSTADNEELKKLYSVFEQEFGRLLSPMETSQVLEWYYGNHYSPELILEALKRAVLRGVLNFRYIDSILRDWARQRIKSPRQVAACEKQGAPRSEKATQHPGAGVRSKAKKYEDVYLT
ncbi:MAG: DnaD domain protein [Clostridia bacterium]|nr:DnaD domain protein [Clostridia bacterium]